ncbi:MAG: PD-(D/E)XK nuclease family protein [Marinifilaceae bacterium]
MSEIIDRIVQFKNSTTTQSLRQYYATNSLMEIYSINRKEIKHTSFFKWLFDTNTEIAKSALKKILDVIITKSDLNTFSNELQQLIILGNYEIDYWNSIENLSVNNGFVDLYIELKIANFNVEIIIENKIYSNEHNDQTQRYYDHFSKENKNTEKIFLYLTPISTLELEKLIEAECCCKNYIQINYQTIVDQIIEPIIEEGVNKNIEFILQDYLKALSSPVSTKENNNKYMAISNKENELLSRFWEENEDLILKAVEATKDNTHIEPERRDTASKISELLNNKSEKIGAYAKRNIVSLFKQNKINQEEIINFQDAEYSKKILDIQYPLLKKVINRNDKPLHYWKDTVFANNDEYHLCCEWFENENNNDRVYFDKWLKTK